MRALERALGDADKRKTRRDGAVYCNNPTVMQKFTYRTPRYPVNLPVRLTLDGGTISGRCHEISREGMRLELREPLPPDYAGVAFLSYQNVDVQVPVEFAHAGAPQDGVRFVFASDRQRSDVARLVALLASNPGKTGLALVK